MKVTRASDEGDEGGTASSLVSETDLRRGTRQIIFGRRSRGMKVT